jgi:transcriptional regulator with XRE-family HTH domain
MPTSDPSLQLESFQTFGDLLKYLRRRARLTQRELSIAVKYSEAQISRLEQNQSPPDLTALTALFIPALYIGITTQKYVDIFYATEVDSLRT